MLFRIRSKLLLYFIVLVVLLTSVGLFFYNSTEKLVTVYDDSFEKFLLLNDISQTTNRMAEELHAYILDKEEADLKQYGREKIKLIDGQNMLFQLMDEHDPALSNYKNMIDSFIDECDATIAAFKKDEINGYTKHFNEVLKINSFLQESTLALLNNKLTEYHQYDDEIEQQNSFYKKMSISLFAAAFFLSTLLALWISGGITRPISRLSEAAKQISSGNLAGADIKTTSNDELKLLTETFNRMRSNLRQLVLEIKQKSELDKLLKELELKSLQNQINPHFLFNTLNTVSKMAYLEEAEKTSRLIESVAAILRYNLGDVNHASTLGDEVRVVKEYFYIQQTRFGDRIEFITDIDDSCLGIRIPGLILQPLVENAFIHGIESLEENAKICLAIRRNHGRTIIEVADNGEGMNGETLNRLKGYAKGRETDPAPASDTSRGQSTGIGVKNVIRRLQLFFQKTDVVEIESELGKGTVFRLNIPDHAGGEEKLAENPDLR